MSFKFSCTQILQPLNNSLLGTKETLSAYHMPPGYSYHHNPLLQSSWIDFKFYTSWTKGLFRIYDYFIMESLMIT